MAKGMIRKVGSKVNSGARALSRGVRSLAKAESIGGFGRKIVKHGSHALLALASRNRSNIGPIPVAPDLAATGLAGLGMMFLKGRNRKIAGDILEGGISALISRAVYGSIELDLSGVVSGKTAAPKNDDADEDRQAA